MLAIDLLYKKNSAINLEKINVITLDRYGYPETCKNEIIKIDKKEVESLYIWHNYSILLANPKKSQDKLLLQYIEYGKESEAINIFFQENTRGMKNYIMRVISKRMGDPFSSSLGLILKEWSLK
jgi:hypothetical protein